MGCPSPSPYGSEVDLVVHDSLGAHGRPGAHYLKWTINTLGTRGPEVAARRGPGVLQGRHDRRIGDVRPVRGAPGREYPRQLEDSLRAYLARGTLWRLTGGRSAECGLFRHVVCRLPPRTFGCGLPDLSRDGGALPHEHAISSDALPKSECRRPYAAHCRSRFRCQAQASRTLSGCGRSSSGWLPARGANSSGARRYGESLPAHDTAGASQGCRLDRLAAYEADLRAFVGAVRSIGAEPVLATHANLFVGGTVSDSSLLRAWERFYPAGRGAGHPGV